MAEVDGYDDRQKWALDGKVPAWWISVLFQNSEPLSKADMAQEEIETEVTASCVK